MAINNIAVPATDSQIHYLKQLAALQFPGSIDNYSTITPIHVLQQQLRSDEDMSLSDAANSGYTLGEGTRFYDNEGNGYDSISKLVMDAIGICSDEEVQEYNIENPERPFVRFEELNNLDNTPVFLRYIDNEEDYVNAYAEDIKTDADEIRVCLMSHHYEALGYAFTHRALFDVKKSLSNHIYNPCRTYADCGEGFGREAGDFYPLMNFMYSAGEQLLADDAKDVEILEKGRMTDDEVETFYREHPHEETLAVDLDIFERGTNNFIKNIRVYTGGFIQKSGFGNSKEYPVCEKHRVVVTDKSAKTRQYPYPFSCDGGIKALNKTTDKNAKLSAAQQLYFWTEYKKSNN